MRRPEAAVHSLSVRRLAKAAGLSEAALLRRALRGELDAEHANGLIAWLLEAEQLTDTRLRRLLGRKKAKGT